MIVTFIAWLLLHCSQTPYRDASTLPSMWFRIFLHKPLGLMEAGHLLTLFLQSYIRDAQ